MKTLLLLILMLLLCPQSLFAEGRLQAMLDEHLRTLKPSNTQTFAISIYVAEQRSGKELYAWRAKEPMIPASALKIITTAAALRILGADYRFPTEIFVDNLPWEGNINIDRSAGLAPATKEKTSVGSLYVRGYGDPSLVFEEVLLIAENVQRHGITEIQDLVLDDALFIDPPPPSGPRPYQSALGALSVNHNCYTVSAVPSIVGKVAHISLTPGLEEGNDFGFKLINRVTTKRGKHSNILVSQVPGSSALASMPSKDNFDMKTGTLTPVKVSVTGTIGSRSNQVLKYLTVPDPTAYLGALLKHSLEQAGIKVKGRVLKGETRGAAKKLFVHESKPLIEILRELNHYSSNYIAGQVLYALGQDSVGYFRRDVGLARLEGVLERLGYTVDDFEIRDASGLDRGNRLTTEQISKVLIDISRDFSIAPDYISTLSRFGRTGTLKKRNLSEGTRFPKGSELERELTRISEGVWAKTGTINGVSSVAGYLETRTGQRRVFAVFINGEQRKDLSIKIENEIVKILAGI